jgi:hypothetical protein
MSYAQERKASQAVARDRLKKEVRKQREGQLADAKRNNVMR